MGGIIPLNGVHDQPPPLPQVVDDVAVMGFSRSEVRGRGGVGLHVCVCVCGWGGGLSRHDSRDYKAPALHTGRRWKCWAGRTLPPAYKHPALPPPQVRAVIQEMMDRGQAIDLNVVLDKLASR